MHVSGIVSCLSSIIDSEKKYTSGFKFAQLEMSKQATLVLLPFTFIDIIVIFFFIASRGGPIVTDRVV